MREIVDGRDVVADREFVEGSRDGVDGRILVVGCDELDHFHSPHEWTWQENVQNWTEVYGTHEIVETENYEHHTLIDPFAEPPEPYRILKASEATMNCDLIEGCEELEKIGIAQEYPSGSWQLRFRYDFTQTTEIFQLKFVPMQSGIGSGQGYGIRLDYDPITMTVPTISLIKGELETVLDTANAFDVGGMANPDHSITLSRDKDTGELIGKVDGVDLLSADGDLCYLRSCTHMVLAAFHFVDYEADLIPVYYDIVSGTPEDF